MNIKNIVCVQLYWPPRRISAHSGRIMIRAIWFYSFRNNFLHPKINVRCFSFHTFIAWLFYCVQYVRCEKWTKATRMLTPTNCINEIIFCSLHIRDEFHFWREAVSSSCGKIYYANTISDMMSVNDLKVFLSLENVCKETKKKKKRKLKKRKTGKRWLKIEVQKMKCF